MPNQLKKRTQLIEGKKNLRAFREYWDGPKILDLLKENDGRMIITWAVGVGKSWNIDAVIKEAIEGGRYDLVMAFFPVRRLINERAWIKSPPFGLKIVNLKPRPKKKCGRERNQKWAIYETQGLGLLGRKVICSECPNRKICVWPEQFGKTLINTDVIFATQAYLEIAPNFTSELKKWCQASRALVLLDEDTFAVKPFRHFISKKEIKDFHDVLKVARPDTNKKSHDRWIYLTGLLLKARTKDLRCDEWHMPSISLKWSAIIQETGVEIKGEGFRFIASDLTQFGKSVLSTREKTPGGDISFAVSPFLNTDFIIYSGTAPS